MPCCVWDGVCGALLCVGWCVVPYCMCEGGVWCLAVCGGGVCGTLLCVWGGWVAVCNASVCVSCVLKDTHNAVNLFVHRSSVYTLTEALL